MSFLLRSFVNQIMKNHRNPVFVAGQSTFWNIIGFFYSCCSEHFILKGEFSRTKCPKQDDQDGMKSTRCHL